MKMDNHARVATSKVYCDQVVFICMICADPEFLPKREFEE